MGLCRHTPFFEPDSPEEREASQEADLQVWFGASFPQTELLRTHELNRSRSLCRAQFP